MSDTMKITYIPSSVLRALYQLTESQRRACLDEADIEIMRALESGRINAAEASDWNQALRAVPTTADTAE